MAPENQLLISFTIPILCQSAWNQHPVEESFGFETEKAYYCKSSIEHGSNI